MGGGFFSSLFPTYIEPVRDLVEIGSPPLLPLPEIFRPYLVGPEFVVLQIEAVNVVVGTVPENLQGGRER